MNNRCQNFNQTSHLSYAGFGIPLQARGGLSDVYVDVNFFWQSQTSFNLAFIFFLAEPPRKWHAHKTQLHHLEDTRVCRRNRLWRLWLFAGKKKAM